MDPLLAAAARRRRSGIAQLPTLSVASPPISVAINASASVTVTISRGNYSGDVVLSATGLPANTSASFTPTTLSGDATTSVMLLTTTNSAVAGPTTAAVVATPQRLSVVTSNFTVTITGAPSGASVPFTVSRQDGGSGPTDIIGGFPLAAGELFPAGLAGAGIRLNTGSGLTEVGCSLAGMDEYHADGSYAWVLMGVPSINPSTIIAGELKLSGSVVARVSPVTPVLLPTTYWVPGKARCDIFAEGTKMVPTGHASIPAYMSAYDAAYARRVGPGGYEFTFGVTNGNTSYYQWSDGRSVAPYDHGAIMAMFGYRDANAFYWRQMLVKGQTLTTNSQSYSYVQSNVSEYGKFESRSFAWAWRLTGHQNYRIAGGNHARYMVSRCLAGGWFNNCGTLSDDVTGSGDNRLPSKALDGFIAGVQCNFAFGSASETGAGGTFSLNLAGLKLFLEGTLKIVAASSGQMGGTGYAGTTAPNVGVNGEKAFMSFMTCASWRRYHGQVENDTRILPLVVAHNDYAYTNLWSPSGDGQTADPCYKYTQFEPNAKGDPMFLLYNGTKGTNPTACSAIAWDARANSNSTKRTHLQTLLESAYTYSPEWDQATKTAGTSGKIFDEFYLSLFSAMYDIVHFGV